MTRELFSGHGWKVFMEKASLPDGRTKNVARVHRADSVHIIAFAQKDTILLLREFRPFYGSYVWMLPSGRADKETDPKAAAQRELQEETGFRAGSIEFLWTTRHSESFQCANHIYRASDLTPDPLPQDHDELIEVHELAFEEAVEKVLACSIVHTPSAYALLRYERKWKR